MIRATLLLCALFLAGCAPDHDALPASLVGVWASDGAVLNGEALIEGHAIYLESDGSGAMLFGPPAIGIKVLATFDSSTNVIDLMMFENEKAVGNSTAILNPASGTIQSGKNHSQTLHRRFDSISTSTKRAIGI
jgi:hypothetical protein